ncbi:efflux RND transporter periplasmic adaptor subunit [Alkalilimnicola sp. S0819]|uniref:efflux RND transporter periplasmic adaptor subunit n=1 Tax=Alkalilimnicola sp. S0819 TaxID=2613922 RepID=UPI001262A292|nr:efflux RND transporter periplasmic adaptor subunit [Alkalilimnicola sp. S0819]KAB7627170.1 efflux RND transporter periplasmic adaptor subunit [Alkalilimnicola sp. S0819]MPQ15881.1 efflux RND transporter periplasmic adaptor subunit [Alkalilimnicola sp. S0819]
MPLPVRLRRSLLPVLLLVSLAACDSAENADQAAAAPPPPEVAVFTVEAAPLTLSEVLPGRLEASRIAQVRARAAGIVEQRVFREGALVDAGQVLFRIDPAPLEAALASARASLARAEAILAQADTTVERLRPLADGEAVSRQEFDNALAARDQAAAEVAAARAALRGAELNLDYATVTAPIAGRIGRALVTEGALVGQGEATPLARIQQTDPIYANLVQPGAEVLRLRRALTEGRLKTLGEGEARVSLVLEDGRVYERPGKLIFTDLTVDEGTGAVTLRAEFPNPDGFLLPGMFVRARLEQAVREQAITVPQQAVLRDSGGEAYVWRVDADNRARQHPVSVSHARNNRWLIESGLTAGDVIIVEGLQKVRPKAEVRTVPWKAPAASATPPATGQG